MPARRKTPYSGPRRRGPDTKYLRYTMRLYPQLWARLEALAAREIVSMNSLANALFEVALECDETEEGRSRIHQACGQWRTRWERQLTAQRQRRTRPRVEPGAGSAETGGSAL